MKGKKGRKRAPGVANPERARVALARRSSGSAGPHRVGRPRRVERRTAIKESLSNP